MEQKQKVTKCPYNNIKKCDFLLGPYCMFTQVEGEPNRMACMKQVETKTGSN